VGLLAISNIHINIDIQLRLLGVNGKGRGKADRMEQWEVEGEGWWSTKRLETGRD
jgi:hypothetical protein